MNSIIFLTTAFFWTVFRGFRCRKSFLKLLAELRAQAQRLQEEAERERLRQLALAAEAQGELFPLALTQWCPLVWWSPCRAVSSRSWWPALGQELHQCGGQGADDVSALWRCAFVGSRSSMVKVICLAVLEGGPGCAFTTQSMQQSLSSPRPVEDGYYGSWMLDFTYLFLLVAERNSLPVPMPRKRCPQSSPHPPDQSQQPPVPRPRSKLTEVAILSLLGSP